MVYQTNAIEYTVTRRLGGTERSPPFSIDPSDTEAFARPDVQNIRHFTVEELGVVDLSLIEGSPSVGVRFVPWVWINSPVFPGLGLCQVVDAESLKVMKLAFTTTGTLRYFREGIIVPQGGSLKFGEWVIPPGERPLRLRISIVPPTNTLQWAAMHQAFCCIKGEPVVAVD